MKDERGVTAVEYSLVIGFVSLVVIAAAVNLSDGFVAWANGLTDLVGDLLA